MINKKSRHHIKAKLRKRAKYLIVKRNNEKLKGKNFIIISNNCWGGQVYQWHNRQYNTPFVGLFLYGPCYLKLLKNFNYYMTQELKFINKSIYPNRPKTYPIGQLNDIEIHFTHYKTEEEALEKWNKRTARMLKETDLDNYYFKICDRELVTPEHFTEFHNLPYKNKVSFAVNMYPFLKDVNHIMVYESHKNNNLFVPDGKRMHKLTFNYFNVTNWLLQ